MRALILAGSLIGGVAALVLMVSGSAPPPADPTGTGVVPSDPVNPLGYLTGVLMLVGGVAIFWFPLLATLALGLGAALGVGIGVMDDSQDQLAFGILAIFLTALALAIVLREGRVPDQVVEGDRPSLNES
jgi:hypothetical protein